PNNAPYSKEEILNTLDKRPLTQEDINLLLDEESRLLLLELIQEEKVSIKTVSNLEFLVPSENIKRKKKKS
ncbi:MAG: radical SAM protein, partial [Campylobacterota bacterium]|nr:radical SAM protein [Campylobacterota bacterium]